MVHSSTTTVAAVFLLGLGQIAITDSDIRSAADGWSDDNDAWDAFGNVEEVVGTSDLNEESTHGRLLIEGELSSRMHSIPPLFGQHLREIFTSKLWREMSDNSLYRIFFLSMRDYI